VSKKTYEEQIGDRSDEEPYAEQIGD